MKRSANITTTQDASAGALADGHAYPVNSKSQGKRVRVDTNSVRPFPPTPSSPNNHNEDGGDVTTKPSTEPKYHREPSSWENPTPTEKAYKNSDFLNSSHARPLRILAEYEETMQRLSANGIKATVQFFGSARSKDREQYEDAKAKLEARLRAAAPNSAEHAEAAAALEKNASLEWMIEYMEKTRELARRLTAWSMNSRLSREAQQSGVSRNKSKDRLDKLIAEDDDGSLAGGLRAEEKKKPPYKYPPHATDGGSSKGYSSHAGLYVCTGGAGGFMEAANRGAAEVPGGRSIGMGISLPFEKGLNPYVSDELAFEFHYFFTRKFAMAYHMQALVVAPGGFGTCDEMFEIMTLKQTGKMQKNLPIVLLGKAHWLKVIDWKAFEESGTIAKKDVDELLFTDDVDEAFEYITERLTMD